MSAAVLSYLACVVCCVLGLELTAYACGAVSAVVGTAWVWGRAWTRERARVVVEVERAPTLRAKRVRSQGAA